ncbi:hypothetical protein BOX15_Mlig032873g1 [Macrostomum lignano]|uniref:AN1-type domain-containing protein n=1 Tax=Macrostomum lignano TaxID=282301 RepID=A0A267G7M6_9PLAT|nr:hypothetical protein BOX15_Mlig032873g1 [Macrostomum lignano]
MDLYIDCPLGPTLRLSASPCDTVLSVKLRLQALLCNSLPANQQRLVWRTCELVNERQLSDYSLESGCTIRLLPRLFAGPTNMQQLPSASAFQQQQQQLLAFQAYRLTMEQQQLQQQLQQQYHQQPVLPSTSYSATMPVGYYLVYCLRPSNNRDGISSVGGGGGSVGFDLVCVSYCLATATTSTAIIANSANEAQTSTSSSSSSSSSSPKSQPDLLHISQVDARDSVNPRSVDRCQACRRRTGPSSSFECRCGRIYCARHRYPESHSCSFDFKEQGRQLLRESNPRVLAPKLQRI